MKKKPILLTLFLLFLTACSVVDSDEQRLESALEFTGKNRYELENVLNHYKNDTWAHFKKGAYLKHDFLTALREPWIYLTEDLDLSF